MDQPVLSDKSQYPSDEIISLHLGKTKAVWDSFFDYLHKDHPDIIPEWRYYNDGKSWLMKGVRKKKNVFWLSLHKGYFRVTLCYTDRAAKTIADSTIPAELKKQFKEAKYFNTVRGLTVVFKYKKDIATVNALLAIKLSAE